MTRPKGSRNRLVTLDYDSIGALVGIRIRGNTAKRYAQRGQYDSRSLEGVLRWINGRRQQQGLPLIGIPDGEVVSDDTPTPVETPPPDDTRGHVLAGGLVYDPMPGEFQGLDDDEHR